MAVRVLEGMNDQAGWSALAPDGLTPSDAVSVEIDATRWRHGDAHASLRIAAGPGATGHLVRRSMPAVEVSAFDELRLWALSTRRGDGTPGSPCFLEVQLAGAAMDAGAPGNTWARLLRFPAPGVWEQQRLTLADLPAVIRGGVTLLQLRCIDVPAAFQVNLDDAAWVRPELIADVDAALLAALDGRVSLGGRAVPALLAVGGAAPAPTPPAPYLLVTNYDLRFSDERTHAARVLGERSREQALVRPQSFAYDIYYQIDVVAQARAEEAALLEFVARALPPRTVLLVAGDALPCEAVFLPAHARVSGYRSGRVQRWFRVRARQEVGAALVLPPVSSVGVVADAAGT